jgi:hypothetical protein
MKYRILKDEELAELEDILKQFLIVNGVQGDEWKRLNEEEPDKALDLIELFSDHVLQVVYEKTFYLEKLTPNMAFFFHFEPSQITLISIQRKNLDDGSIDLSSIDNVLNALKNKTKDLVYFRQQKAYSKSRELEMHEMFQSGCAKMLDKDWKIIDGLTA